MKFTILSLIIIQSFGISQTIMQRLFIPVYLQTSLSLGYDNNFMRLSDKEIREDDVHVYGVSKTLDSPILKSAVKLIYSPEIIDDKTINIITSFSYSHFSQMMKKSYLITSLSLELKLRSHSWLKVGIRDIPKYYLRNYHDWDLSNIDYYECTFSNQEYFASYSRPIKRLDRTWMKVYSGYTKEYYNPHFTEFDLHKYMLQIEINHRFENKHKIKLSIAHGSANNISYGSYLSSSSFDRSYIFDKLRSELIYKNKSANIFEKLGISLILEQRYYELESSQYSFDNWKFYLDGRAKVWVDWDIIYDIGFKTYYQFRWRDASTRIYGDFDWVEDIKSYTKHEIWLEFSYEFVSDILY